MIKLSGELSASQRDELSSSAFKVRSLFASGRARTKEESGEQERRKKKQFLVKGRIHNGVVLWDVYRLDGYSEPAVVGSSFSFQEEAIFFARDRSLGRLSVGMSGVRGLFKAGGAGVLQPGRTIEKPHEQTVPMRHVGNGVLIG